MPHKGTIGIALVLLVIGLLGCSNPYKQSAKAATEASTSEKAANVKKAEILEDYRKCLKKNKSDEQACAAYKKAIDSL